MTQSRVAALIYWVNCFAGLELQANVYAEVARLALLGKGALHVGKLEGVEIVSSEVLSPEFNVQMIAYFGSNACRKLSVEGLAHGVGLVPLDFAGTMGAHVGSDGLEKAVAQRLAEVGHGNESVARHERHSVVGVVYHLSVSLAQVVVFENGVRKTVARGEKQAVVEPGTAYTDFAAAAMALACIDEFAAHSGGGEA